MPGQIVHVEIPADDTTGGQAFWGSLFGWQFEGFPGPFEYHVTQISEQTGGAITDMEPGKQGLRVYFDVEQDTALTTIRPGSQVVCTDPHGNEFGLWQNDPSAAAPAA